jgi:predicted dehydrogenase
MTDRVRVAVVGAGKWAQMAHLPAFHSNVNVDVVAVVDPDPTRANHVRRVFEIPASYTSLSELLDHETVDLVDICTDNRHHYPLAMAALSAGCHVLCEKPLGLTLEEARQMVSLARQRGVKAAVGFTFRHSPALRHMKRLLAEGYLGRLYHVQGFEQNALYHDPKEPKPVSWLSQDQDVGALGGYASHLIDLVRWLAGDFEAVVGHLQNYIPMRATFDGRMQPCDVDDSAVFLGLLRGGVQGVFQASWLAAGRPPGVELRVFGERGALWVRLAEHPEHPEELWAASIKEGLFERVAVPAMLRHPLTRDNWPEAYYTNLVDHLIHAIRNDGPVEGSFEDGWQCQRVLEAVARSAAEQRWYRLDELP